MTLQNCGRPYTRIVFIRLCMRAGCSIHYRQDCRCVGAFCKQHRGKRL